MDLSDTRSANWVPHLAPSVEMPRKARSSTPTAACQTMKSKPARFSTNIPIIDNLLFAFTPRKPRFLFQNGNVNITETKEKKEKKWE